MGLEMEIDAMGLEIKIDAMGLEIKIGAMGLEMEIDAMGLEMKIDAMGLEMERKRMMEFPSRRASYLQRSEYGRRQSKGNPVSFKILIF